MSETPPPLPPGPPSGGDAGKRPEPGPDKRLERVADTIGFVPNIRKKDNLYQGLAVLVFMAIGAGVGAEWYGWPNGVILGALAGLVAGTLISGLVLMVAGWTRRS